MTRKKVENALALTDNSDRIAFARFVAASGSEENVAFANALVDPNKQDMDIKCVAISCGMDLVALSQMFKHAALAEAMMTVSTTIANNVNNVVTSALTAAMGEEANEKDRRLALEVCGVIESKNSSKINLNLNQDINTNHGYERAAKTGTKVLEVEEVKKPFEEFAPPPPSHKKKPRLEVEE